MRTLSPCVPWSFLGHNKALLLSFSLSLSCIGGKYLPATALLLLVPLSTEAAYTAIQLTTLPPGSTHVVKASNDAGEVVGGTRLGRGHRGFILNPGAPPESIEGMSSSDYSVALGINNLGETVGTANTANGIRGFRARRATGAAELAALPGDSGSAATAISQTGQVAGYSTGPSGIRAVVWNRAGNIQSLPLLSGSTSTRGLAINDQGDVAGVSDTSAGLRAVVWKNGSARILSMLPEHTANEALSINNSGEVVGSSGDPTIERRAVLWSPDGVARDLGALAGGISSRALSINGRSEVVGGSESGNGNRAFLWTLKGGIRDLNDLLTSRSDFVLTEAVSISPNGVIVAIGQDKPTAVDGHGHDHEDHELPLRVFRLVPAR